MQVDLDVSSFFFFFLEKDARTGTKDAAKAMVTKSKVSQQEALQILNMQKQEMKPDLILKVRTVKLPTIWSLILPYAVVLRRGGWLDVVNSTKSRCFWLWPTGVCVSVLFFISFWLLCFMLILPTLSDEIEFHWLLLLHTRGLIDPQP